MSLVLGKKITTYPDTYSAASHELLQCFPRSQQRAHLPLDPLAPLPFQGCDWWNHYEMGWLDAATGWPQQAFLRLEIPASSPNLIESKSLKIYLGSFANSLMSREQLQEHICADLSLKAGVPITVIVEPWGSTLFHNIASHQAPWVNLSEIEIPCEHYTYEASLLDAGLKPLDKVASEQYFLFPAFRSNCLVTGQPDWAHIFVRYMPDKTTVSPEALLRYLVSFRQHQEFHEHCVERIFCDLFQRLNPRDLVAYGAFFRRGSLDINPVRSMGALCAQWARQPYH